MGNMSSSTNTSSSTSTTPTPTSTGAPGVPSPGADPLHQLFGQMMNSMAGRGAGVPGVPGAPAPVVDPSIPAEQRFQIQLEQLSTMGFHDRAANIQGKIVYLFISEC